MSDPQQPQGAALLSMAARFDLERTRIAYENLMMSWIRTATSLITFGFSVYKFFQIEGHGGGYANRLVSAREFAIALVLIGLGALALATIEYRQNTQVLKAHYPDCPRSLAGLVAVLISLLGVIALGAVLFRQ